VQAVFQIVVLTIIIFYGDLLFGVASDRELSHFTWNEVNGYHFTIFFNIFYYKKRPERRNRSTEFSHRNQEHYLL